MTDISRIQGISTADSDKLRRCGIKTVVNLWQRVGLDLHKGVDKVAKKANISHQVLIAILAADASGEARLRRDVDPVGLSLGIKSVFTKGPRKFWERYGHEIKQAWFGLKVPWLIPKTIWSRLKWLWQGRRTYWPDWTLMIMPLLFILLSIYAVNYRYWKNLPVAWKNIVVAKEDLAPNAVLKKDLLETAFRWDEPDAVAQMGILDGRKAKREIKRGEIIHAGDVEPNPSKDQIVVVASTGLAANHIIGINDVALIEKPKQEGTFSSIIEVIGRYPLKAVPAGATLRGDQLSSARLSQSDLSDYQILSIPIRTGAYNSHLTPASCVSLLFSPRVHDLNPPAEITGALLLGADRQGEVFTITLAIKKTDIPTVIKWLAIADIYISQGN